MSKTYSRVCKPSPLKLPLISDAIEVLSTADPRAKAARAREMTSAWRDTQLVGKPPTTLPDQPARPAKPELVSPMDVPRRRLGSSQGRGALLHAVAHIELNAIDLAADMIARFTLHPAVRESDRKRFAADWTSVCDDEARHFLMLADRLEALGLSYGDYPAHNGLWEAAHSTRDNFPARVAIAPLVLEARGLDVTPNMINRLNGAGDHKSAQMLQVIYDEEIGHVATGARWFKYLAAQQADSAESYFHELVRTHFKGQIKSPFNEKARTLAGLARTYYEPLSVN